jgi:PAS domain S-box-containing protein
VAAGLAFAFAVAQSHKGKADQARILPIADDEVNESVRMRTHQVSELNERLRSREEQFRVIAELSPIHLFAYGTDGAAQYVSSGFSSLTGLAPERTTGFGWTQALHPDDRPSVMSAWKDARAAGKELQSEFRVREAGGSHRWFKVKVVPVRNESGELVQWVGAAADIDEQRQLLTSREAALQREQEARAEAERANRLKDEFLGTVSHELRTPLNAIVGWAHLLKGGRLSPGENRQAIDAIDRNARALTRLVEDLLDVSHLIQGRVKLHVAPCDLGPLVAGILDNLRPAADAKHLAVELHNAGSEATVAGDEARLKQIAWNLLSNAVRFTPRGGQIAVGVARDQGRVRLEVSDSGEGIDPKFLPHVFDAFRQGPSYSQRSGLGLGLAIVRHLVELHGGSVRADSPGVGRGSTFTVLFPTIDGVTDGERWLPPSRQASGG